MNVAFQRCRRPLQVTARPICTLSTADGDHDEINWLATYLMSGKPQTAILIRSVHVTLIDCVNYVLLAACQRRISAGHAGKYTGYFRYGKSGSTPPLLYLSAAPFVSKLVVEIALGDSACPTIKDWKAAKRTASQIDPFVRWVEGEQLEQRLFTVRASRTKNIMSPT